MVYNLCYSLFFCYTYSNSCLPRFVSSFQVQFLPLPHLLILTVLASILLFHSWFHLPVLRFQLLFWLLTAASLSSFLSSHLYKYLWKLGGSIEVSLHSNFFCTLLFCLMVFFFFPFYVCFCLFLAVVWMVVRVLNLLLLGYLIGALLFWVCSFRVLLGIFQVGKTQKQCDNHVEKQS